MTILFFHSCITSYKVALHVLACPVLDVDWSSPEMLIGFSNQDTHFNHPISTTLFGKEDHLCHPESFNIIDDALFSFKSDDPSA